MADFEVNRRLKKVITEVYKMTPHKFSIRYNDKGGVKTSQVIRERNGLSNNLLEEILYAYPEINRTWLLTGEGEILKNQENGKTLSEEQPNYKVESDMSILIRTNAELVRELSNLRKLIEKLTDTDKQLANKIVETETSEELINGAAKTA